MKARQNPFRTERMLQVRYRLADEQWAGLLARCRQLNYFCAIIGPHGSGKTTLLEDLEPRLKALGFSIHFLQLTADNPGFAPGVLKKLFAELGPKKLILFDGAEQMSFLAWLWFRWRTRKAGGLLITTHRRGRLPTLWQCHTSAELLAEIGAELLGTTCDSVSMQASLLFQSHRGNLREALLEWYDLAGTAPMSSPYS